jgi:hypothetical protein
VVKISDEMQRTGKNVHRLSRNECHCSGARVFWMVNAAPIRPHFKAKVQTSQDLLCVCPCIVVICGEEKSTRCRSMIYRSCELLYMFRALICPSSGAPRLYLDYNKRCEVPKLLVVGRQVQGSRLCVQRERAVAWPSLDTQPAALHLPADHQQFRHFTPRIINLIIVSGFLTLGI